MVRKLSNLEMNVFIVIYAKVAGKKYYYFHIILKLETIFMIIKFVLEQLHNVH